MNKPHHIKAGLAWATPNVPSASLGPRNPKQPLRLFTESELRQRLGSLDAEAVAKEIAMSTEELDEHMEVGSKTTFGGVGFGGFVV